jgi:hypothetical protein
VTTPYAFVARIEAKPDKVDWYDELLAAPPEILAADVLASK